MVEHTCNNPRTWKAKAEGLLWICGQPGLHSEFWACLYCGVRFCLNKRLWDQRDSSVSKVLGGPEFYVQNLCKCLVLWQVFVTPFWASEVRRANQPASPASLVNSKSVGDFVSKEMNGISEHNTFGCLLLSTCTNLYTYTNIHACTYMCAHTHMNTNTHACILSHRTLAHMCTLKHAHICAQRNVFIFNSNSHKIDHNFHYKLISFLYEFCDLLCIRYVIWSY